MDLRKPVGFVVALVAVLWNLLGQHFEYNANRNLALENLVDLLWVYDVYDQNNNKITLKRHGRDGDGGYLVPEIALQKADVLMGYGIADDISFEEEFSNLFNKKSYGFDCGIEAIAIKNNLCTFLKECISSDKFLYSNQKSSQNISSFSSQLQKLNLLDQNLFIKMDIEGAEYDAFKGIYQYADHITGIVLEIHFSQLPAILEATNLLINLERDFYLVHVHPNNCSHHIFNSMRNIKGDMPHLLELTFINKKLVGNAKISDEQVHPTKLDMPNCPKKENKVFELTNHSNTKLKSIF